TRWTPVRPPFWALSPRSFSRLFALPPPLSAAFLGRMNVIDHVRDMAAAGLHSNVRLLSSLLLTMSNNNPELFSPSQKYQLLVYHADSLFHDKEYRNAVSKYTMALQQKKALSKTSKVRPSTGNSASTPQSQGVNWLLSLCKGQGNKHDVGKPVQEGWSGATFSHQL
ncbi:ANAPC7, partial [Cervus elaphus hippelaphus]